MTTGLFFVAWYKRQKIENGTNVYWNKGLAKIVAFFFFFWHLYWSIIALQWCVSFCFITKWISYTYVPISLPSCVSLPPQNCGFQNVVLRSAAAPGNLLEMHILRPHPQSTGWARQSVFRSTRKFENHRVWILMLNHKIESYWVFQFQKPFSKRLRIWMRTSCSLVTKAAILFWRWT